MVGRKIKFRVKRKVGTSLSLVQFRGDEGLLLRGVNRFRREDNVKLYKE